MNGSAGLDAADYQNALTAVLVDLSTPANNTGEAAGDTFVLIEAIIGGGFDDTLTGDAGDNILIGGVGADVLSGGTGLDYAGYFEAATAVVIDLDNPANNTGEAAGDSYASIENISGGEFDDTVTGDADNNFLMGSGGADVLDGGAGFDYADYMFSDSALVVDLGTPANSTGEAAGDTYISIEGIRASDFNDTLSGDLNANVLDGGAGDDSMSGRGGKRSCAGWAGQRRPARQRRAPTRWWGTTATTSCSGTTATTRSQAAWGPTTSTAITASIRWMEAQATTRSTVARRATFYRVATAMTLCSVTRPMTPWTVGRATTRSSVALAMT